MNGWSNPETWELYTVISNSEWQYNLVMQLRKETTTAYQFADALKEHFDYGESKVNWLEIAEVIGEFRK